MDARVRHELHELTRMTAQRREQFQLSILTVLEANHSPKWGLPLDAVTLHVSGYGFAAITRDQVETELEYLAEKGLAETVGKVLEPANRVWRRTAAGRDYLSERGAI
jgi:hypothetical protein